MISSSRSLQLMQAVRSFVRQCVAKAVLVIVCMFQSSVTPMVGCCCGCVGAKLAGGIKFWRGDYDAEAIAIEAVVVETNKTTSNLK